MAIVSLTSIPPRFPMLGKTLHSLACQTAEIDAIHVYIPKRYRRFPDWEGQMPFLPPTVELLTVDEDFGPATKVLHAIRAEQGRATPILFCDDDRVYHRTWAETLLHEHASRPDHCISAFGSHLHDLVPQPACALTGPRARLEGYFDPSYRLQRSLQYLRQIWSQSSSDLPFRARVSKAGYTEVLLGYAGALIQPNFFDESVFDVPDDLWMVDDIWLSGHLARRGVPIWVPRGMKLSKRSQNETIDPLLDSVFGGDDRQTSNHKAVRYFQDNYGVWKAGA